MELVNSVNSNRKRLLRRYGTIFIIALIFFLLKYLLAPEDYKSGQKSSRVWFSLTEFIAFSTVAFIILFLLIVASKIVVKLHIDRLADKVTIEYIDRLKFQSTLAEAKLSETGIYIERLDGSDRFFRKKPDHVAVYLTLPGIKSIRVGPQDFDQQTEVLANYLEKIVEIRAEQHRKKRTGS